jgi:peptide methionine sulfoxide reductase MsrB
MDVVEGHADRGERSGRKIGAHLPGNQGRGPPPQGARHGVGDVALDVVDRNQQQTVDSSPTQPEEVEWVGSWPRQPDHRNAREPCPKLCQRSRRPSERRQIGLVQDRAGRGPFPEGVEEPIPAARAGHHVPTLEGSADRPLDVRVASQKGHEGHIFGKDIPKDAQDAMSCHAPRDLEDEDGPPRPITNSPARIEP